MQIALAPMEGLVDDILRSIGAAQVDGNQHKRVLTWATLEELAPELTRRTTGGGARVSSSTSSKAELTPRPKYGFTVWIASPSSAVVAPRCARGQVW